MLNYKGIKFFIISGLLLAQSIPLEAMDQERARDQYSNSTASILTALNDDSTHPLTHIFWKYLPLSDKFDRIKTDITALEEEIIHLKPSNEVGNFCLKDDDIEKYRSIFEYSGDESELTLIGGNLYLMDNSTPKDIDPLHTPAIIRLENHTYDLFVNTPDGVKRISAPNGINLKDLDAFFEDHHKQIKHFLEWNDPIMKYILSKGGHHPFVNLHNQSISFFIRNIKGGSGCDLAILSRDRTNFIAIKKFSNIKEGLKELLFSLVALNMNPSPNKLKIARIYDAILYSGSLYLIMEGANTGVIHSFLSGDSAENVIKACAEYFTEFHTSSHIKLDEARNSEKYINHVARAAKTLIGNPQKEEEPKKPPLHLLVGKQWNESHFNDVEEDIKASNIIRLLPEPQQEIFVRLAKSICEKYKENCHKYFRSSEADNKNEHVPYFQTTTHGDAHGNNFFYNDDEKLNDQEIPKESSLRVTMIDPGKVIRTHGGIGDPAEDVGRYLASLWDWLFLQNYSEKEFFLGYKRIKELQNLFLKVYLNNIKKKVIFTEEEQKIFERIFVENCDFYQFRFFKAIFNFTKDQDKIKDLKIKLKVLRFWLDENVNKYLNSFSLDRFQPTIFENNTNDCYWVPVSGKIVSSLLDRPKSFVDRAAEESDKSYLTLLWETFHPLELSRSSPEVVIVGMGGIGKTTLALGYAHEALFYKAYNLIYWVLSDKEDSLLKGYRRILHDLDIPVKNEGNDRVIALIKQHVPNKGRCLLIYDNVPNSEFLKDKTPLNTDILITSRCRQGWDAQTIDLHVFRPEESIKYLLDITGIEPNRENQGKAGNLAQELMHFPLALSHAASYIKLVEGNMVLGNSLERYVNKFKKNHSDHFERYQDPFEKDFLEMTYENLVARTYRMSSEHLSDVAKQLMVYCSYLHFNDIPEDIFKPYFGNQVDDSLKHLSEYSLIKRQGKELFDIHPLVQQVIRNEQEQESASLKDKDLLPNICRIFNELSKRNAVRTEQIDRLLKDLPHRLMLIEHTGRLKVVSQEVEDLEWFAKVLHIIAEVNLLRKDESEEKFQQAIAKAKNLFISHETDDVPTWLLEFAQKSHPSVQCALGLMYHENLFVHEDSKKAVLWYTKAAESGDVTAQNNLGAMYLNDRGVVQNYKEAFKWFAKAAIQGYVGGNHNIGSMYYHGYGVDQSYNKALEWYHLAAEQGYEGSQYNIGLMYFDGIGVDQNYEEAFKWFSKAAEQEFAGAFYKLAVMYGKGQGVVQSNLVALQLCNIAAEKGNAAAQNNLGVMYYNGDGVVQNYKKAFKWYKKAAERGDAHAQNTLSRMYANGLGVGQSDVEAFKWIAELAKQGDANAQCDAGVMCAYGRGVDQSDVEAIKWFARAANQGHKIAQHNLIMYLKDQGVKQSDIEAFKRFIKAAEQGDANAQYNLGLMYLNGEGIIQSYQETVKYFTEAADLGHLGAQITLGNMYAYGIGVTPSSQEAIKWHTQAANRGFAPSQRVITAFSVCSVALED